MIIIIVEVIIIKKSLMIMSLGMGIGAGAVYMHDQYKNGNLKKVIKKGSKELTKALDD